MKAQHRWSGSGHCGGGGWRENLSWRGCSSLDPRFATQHAGAPLHLAETNWNPSPSRQACWLASVGRIRRSRGAAAHTLAASADVAEGQSRWSEVSTDAGIGGNRHAAQNGCVWCSGGWLAD